jgi:hypothetical protein
MNGGFPRAYSSLGAPAHPGVHWGRLGAALAASCLVHAAFVVMPYFGASSTAARRAVQTPAPVRVLDLRLARSDSADPLPSSKRARGTNHLPISAPGYYRSDELTRPPRASAEPRLQIPRSVARTVSGRVVLRLWINELGYVDAVEVEDSDLPQTVSKMVAEAFGEVHFSAGELDGKRVRTLMRIEVAYVRGKPRP